MNIVVNKKKFLDAYNFVKIAIDQKAKLNDYYSTGLKAINVFTDGDTIKLSATGKNIETSATLDCIKINEHGSVSIYYEVLDKTTQLYLDSELSIRSENNEVIIKCGKESGQYSQYDIENYDNDESVHHPEDWITIPKEMFFIACDRVSFATCKDKNGIRSKMSSVFFKMTNNTLDLVASDGHMLTKLTIPYEHPIPDFSFLLDVNILLRIFKGIKQIISESIDISITKELLFIKDNNLEVNCTLIDSSYINYDKLIATKKNIHFSICFKRKDLLRKLNTYKFDKGIVGFKFPRKGIMEILNVHEKIDQLSITTEKKPVDKGYLINVALKNLTLILKHLTYDTLCIDFCDPTEIFFIRDTSKNNHITLIQPSVLNTNKWKR